MLKKLKYIALIIGTSFLVALAFSHPLMAAGGIPPVDLTQIGNAFFTLGQKTMANSMPVVPASDWAPADVTAGASTISAQCSDANINTACTSGRITILVSGQATVSVKFVNSTLTTTFKVDCSYDGASTWETGNYFIDASAAPVTTLAFVADSTTSYKGVQCLKPGASHIGIRASAAVTNSSSVSIRAGLFPGGPLYSTTTGGTASPQTLQMQGVAGGTPVGVTEQVTTTGGCIIQRVLSAASTNATSVKASAGQVYGYYFTNTNAAFRWIKLYNKASSPTVGTDTPVLTLGVPPGSGATANCDGSGVAFATGIALAITTGVADSDTGAVAANEVVVNLLYK